MCLTSSNVDIVLAAEAVKELDVFTTILPEYVVHSLCMFSAVDPSQNETSVHRHQNLVFRIPHQLAWC